MKETLIYKFIIEVNYGKAKGKEKIWIVKKWIKWIKSGENMLYL